MKDERQGRPCECSGKEQAKPERKPVSLEQTLASMGWEQLLSELGELGEGPLSPAEGPGVG